MMLGSTYGSPSKFKQQGIADGVSAANSTSQWRQACLLTALVVQWFVFSYLFNVNMKSWFREHPGPDTLLPLQLSIFAGNAVASWLWLQRLPVSHTGMELTAYRRICQLASRHPSDFALMCGSGIAGVAATVVVLQHGSIELVQIARSLGPAFAALWAYLVLDQPTTGGTLGCLVLTLGGTALASWREPTFSGSVAALMLVVNAGLAFRNTASKRVLLSSPPRDAHMLTSLLMCTISTIGTLLIVAIWLVGHAAGVLPARQQVAMLWDRKLLLVASCNFAYNMASQLVLATVQVVSHGMLELSKRVFVVLAASLLRPPTAVLHDWQPHNLAGAALAVASTLGYFACVHHRHAKPAKAHLVCAGETDSDKLCYGRDIGSGAGKGRSASSSTGEPAGLEGLHYQSAAGSGVADVNGPVASSGMVSSAQEQGVLLDEGGCEKRLSDSGGAGTVRRRHSGGGRGGSSAAAPAALRPGSDGGDGTSRAVRRTSSGGGASCSAADGDRGTTAWTQRDGYIGAFGGAPRPPLAPVPLSGSSWPVMGVRGRGSRAIAVPAQAFSASDGSPAGDKWQFAHGLRREGVPLMSVSTPGAALSLCSKARFAQLLITALLLASPAILLWGVEPAGTIQQRHATSQGAAAVQPAGQLAGSAWYNNIVQQFSRQGSRAPHAQPQAAVGESSTWQVSEGGSTVSLAQRQVPTVHAEPVTEHVSTAQNMPHTFLSKAQRANVSASGGGSRADGSSSSTASAQADQDGGMSAQRRSSGSWWPFWRLFETLLGSAVPDDAWGGMHGNSKPGGNGSALHGVYVGWLGHQNLGDEIVADLFLDLLTEAVYGRTPASTKVTVDRDIPAAEFNASTTCSHHENAGCDFAVLGGGSTVYVDYLRRISGALQAGRPVVVFGSGYQTGLIRKSINARYIQMLQGANLLGGVRGPSTVRYLASFNITALPIIYDSGILAHAVYGQEKRASPFLQQLMRGGRPLAVVTCKGSEPAEFMKNATRNLSLTYQVVLQPVDPESLQDHLAVAKSINAALPPGGTPLVVHEEFQDWGAVVNLYQQANVSLNARLHSGVVAVSALRPTVFIANNNKMADFMSSMDLSRFVLDAARLKRASRVSPATPIVLATVEAAATTEAISSYILQHRDAALRQYRALAGQLLDRLQVGDAARYARVFRSCRHVRISRSAPLSYRTPITIACADHAPRGLSRSR